MPSADAYTIDVQMIVVDGHTIAKAGQRMPDVIAPLVGIHGRMHSGKSTLARAVQRRLDGRNSKIIAFAHPLKDAAKALGWNGVKDAKGRRLLQLLGTECGRECIDPNLWVNKWKVEAAAAWENSSAVVIADDMRFVNEASAVVNAGGMLVKIVRSQSEPPKRRWWQFWKRRHRDHASETPMPDSMFHIVIENEGSVADLELIADQIARTVANLYATENQWDAQPWCRS